MMDVRVNKTTELIRMAQEVNKTPFLIFIQGMN
jgi:hypothetical protein